MRIVQFTAENIKKLKVVAITPKGDLVQISGPNGSGKSSVLDSIWWALAGTASLQKLPIRKGTAKAKIEIDLGDIVVTRRFSADGSKNGYLEILNKKGKYKYQAPQTLLDALMSKLSFDPLEFMRMKPADQLEQLRKVSPVDIDIEALDQDNQRDYETRRIIGRDMDAITVRIKDALGIKPTTDPRAAKEMLAAVPRKLVDVAGLVTQLQEAGERNALRERLSNQRDQLHAKHEQHSHLAEERQRTATDLRRQAAELIARAEAAEKQVQNQLEEASATLRAHAAMTIPDAVDTSELAAEIAKANAQNAAIALRIEYEAKEDQSEELRKAREERTARRTAAIAAAKMPVEGLSFGEGEVIYNEIPFDQLSDAEQIKISVALAMAANPTIRVLRIKDGSLLDERSLAQVAEMAHEREYQVWVERVDTSGKVGVVMEEGEVVSDGE